MIRDHFRVMIVDLATGRGRLEKVDGRDDVAGGSGLSALLFDRYASFDKPWDDPDQPLIFAIGPLTGYFPLMSKTVCGFQSPYNDQYAESHAGGRSALALRFADLDALVVTGKAPTPSALYVGNRDLEVRDVHYLWGMEIGESGKHLRRIFPGSGHRSTLRIGPSGEIGSAMAGINVDTYRHFGRMGGGGVMGVKNLKAIVIRGSDVFDAPGGKDYGKLFESVYEKMTATSMMSKYHNLGTAANLTGLDGLKSLPWRNLQQTSDPAIEEITGDRFADDTLLRNAACSGCPVGCIHVGFVREKFQAENQYLYRQVSYDYEPIFAAGTMLGVTDPFRVLAILDTVEQTGLDVMSAGVALAWATEATEKGLITEKETLVPLQFGDPENYRKAVEHLGRGANDFYRLLGMGTLKAAAEYGGADFACVLGQEMAGYATGEVFFASQAMGLRHSHLDTGGYGFDQKHEAPEIDEALDFLVEDEAGRVLLTSMVSCLFARGVYQDDLLRECLSVVGYDGLANRMEDVSKTIQRLRWRVRFQTGFDPSQVKLPRRFYEVETWKGKIDADRLNELVRRYGAAVSALGREEAEGTAET